MFVAWRVCKQRHAPFDGTGAELNGGRWNRRGRAVIYAADSFSGSLLEILVHAMRPRTLPGPHHGVRIEVPDELVQWMEPGELPGWEAEGSSMALAAGEAWLDDRRSVVLVVPSVPSRPVGRTVLINPAHPDLNRIRVSEPFAVPWDERLFG